MNSKMRDWQIYLQDILNAIERILEYTKDGKEEFFRNVLVQDGVIRQLSIIGEAAGKLPDEARDEQNKIPWKDIIGMRNIIIHDYSDVNIKRIWNTVEQDLESLKAAVQKMKHEA